MIGKTLALYFARQFTILVMAIFVFFFFLIAVISYLEFFTRSLATEDEWKDWAAKQKEAEEAGQVSIHPKYIDYLLIT